MPRAIHLTDRLRGLITETWVPPSRSAGLISRFGQRFHPELNLAPVYAWNSTTIVFELSARLTKLRGWPLTLERNRWFQRHALGVFSRLASQVEREGSRPILFAYSYAAIELLRFAKANGWQTVLGQIDGGRCDEELIAREHKKHQGLSSYWQPAPKEYWANWQEECSLADTIVVNSVWSEALVNDAGIDAGKLKVIPVPYQAEARARNFQRVYPEEFSSGRPLRVLFLGAFALRKGAAAVLEAMQLLTNEPVEFWIVGSSGIDIPPTLRRSAKVKWIGPVSRETTADYYRNADLFLFPTISDGFGMTQVEARGWKLPVIATPFCAPIVTDGINGLVLTEISGESLSNAIQFLLKDPTELKRLADGSPQEYDEYSFASVRERLISLGN